MRVGIATTSVLLLTLVSPRLSAERTPLVEVDLGTSVIDHFEADVGLHHVAIGVVNRAMFGTYVLPTLVLPIALPGSYAANAFGRVRAYQRGAFSSSVGAGVFNFYLNDLDGDGTRARGWLSPVRLAVAWRWAAELSTTLEVVGVWAAATASTLAETDVLVNGVALARSSHVGVLQRFSIAPGFTLFVRGRGLIAHSPVGLRAQSEISDTTTITIRGRANAADLSSGFAGVVGAHFDWGWGAAWLAGGYGTWFLPWIYLPVGQNVPIGELNAHVRF